MESWIRVLMFAACLFPIIVECRVRHYKFNVVMKNSGRLCSTKPIVTVNGRFPGPNLTAREGDKVLMKVVNHVKYNVSIHWHGIRQLRTGWADGPAYITQYTMPYPAGAKLYLRLHYNRSKSLPKMGVPYSFPKPEKEAVIILVEVDATHVKPFKTDTIVTAPEQTNNVLVTANKASGRYLIAASPVMDAPIAVDNATAAATMSPL
ncbi:hypothetical protein DCAR_0727551 [Daucus carota subsp. sativus]|uniref:Plastocyanin-like domain-containing protein n=1 Tax=Daucus carota subsp. sativus TaxID=79200 RepID=A0A164T0E5_DAUCS|nr:hypothetical protein DCAR_0727551 [Daucus carota subsp. sativus]